MYFSVCDLSPPHTELFRTETFLWPTTVYMLSEQCPVSDYHLYVAPLPHGKWKGKDGSSVGFPLLGLQNHCGQWLQSWNQKMTASWQESYDKPRQCIEKQRHYSANKVCVVKGMVFPVVKYGYESWTVKKAEPQRIDAFELWCWRRLLRVFWTTRRSNKSILKEINPEYSLEGLMLKLKLPILWPPEATHWKRPCWWERLSRGGEEDDRGWDGWMASSTQWTWVCVNSWSWWWTPWGRKELDMTVTELNWTEQIMAYELCNVLLNSLC